MGLVPLASVLLEVLKLGSHSHWRQAFMRLEDAAAAVPWEIMLFYFHWIKVIMRAHLVGKSKKVQASVG
jgi:hypothetical protein